MAFSTAGSTSVSTSVGIGRCSGLAARLGVVIVMRQKCERSAPGSTGGDAGESTQTLPLMDDSLTTPACACPLMIEVPTVLASAQSAPLFWLPSGGCGPAEAGRPNCTNAAAPVQAVFVSVRGALRAGETRVVSTSGRLAPTASVPAASRTQLTRRRPGPPLSSPASVQVQPGPAETNNSSLLIVSTTRSGCGPPPAVKVAAAMPVLVTLTVLLSVEPGGSGPAVLALVIARSA